MLNENVILNGICIYVAGGIKVPLLRQEWQL